MYCLLPWPTVASQLMAMGGHHNTAVIISCNIVARHVFTAGFDLAPNQMFSSNV